MANKKRRCAGIWPASIERKTARSWKKPRSVGGCIGQVLQTSNSSVWLLYDWDQSCSDTHGSAVLSMIVSLNRRLDSCSNYNPERQFFSHLLQYLTAASGLRIELQNWMVTSYDVEFGRQIGSGGLCVLWSIMASLPLHWFWICNSGQVFLGTWNNTSVAIKVVGDVTPRSIVRHGWVFCYLPVC